MPTDPNFVRDHFLAAAELPAADRAAYLAVHCGGDAELRAAIERLLAAHDQPASILSRLGPGSLEPTAAYDAGEQPRTVAGDRYRILERLGEGGMGVVYRAEQRFPIRREVVLKVIKLGMDSKLVIARFEAERQALAMMDHPHIAKIYDAGVDDAGRPYFVMEYVKGSPITEYCDHKRLTLRHRLELFDQVCQAIQHAHHKGIIHRDIKPSNVLVSTQDGRPFAKVIDFGIAKAMNQRLTDKTLFTEHALMIGTPAYMSPEQADGSLDIDTRADVYSLGVLLYELLTGQTPFDSQRLRDAAFNELARIIRDEEPPKPSTRVNTLGPSGDSGTFQASKAGSATLDTLAKARGVSPETYAKSLRGELDWLVMKAMEKDRARRYETPSALAEDIGRHLHGLPVIAAPPSMLYRLRKFVRKYRLPVAGVLTVASILVVAVASVSALAIQLSRQVSETRAALVDAEAARRRESEQRLEAELQRSSAESSARRAKYESARNRAQYLIEQKLLDQALVAAKEAYRLGGNWEDGLLLGRIVNESRKVWQLEHSVPVAEKPLCAALTETQNSQVIVVAFPSLLAEYDLDTGRLIVQAKITAAPVQLVPFRGQSDRIVAVGLNGISVLNLKSLAPLAEHDFGPQRVIAVDASLANIALTLSDYTIQVYSRDLDLLGSQAWPKGVKLNQDQPLARLAISPNGQWVVASGVTWWNSCLVWDRVGNKATLTSELHGNQLRFTDNTTIISTLTFVGGTKLIRLQVDPTTGYVKRTWLYTFPLEDLGTPSRHSADQNSICISGACGVAVVNFGEASEAFPGVNIQRYSSLLGSADLSPLPLGLAGDGSRLVLACQGRLLILDRTQAPWQGDFAKGHHAALGANSLYEVEPNYFYLYLRVTPADARRLSRRWALAPVPRPTAGWNNTACGAAVSRDQRTLAVRYAEAHGGIITGQKLQNHSVAIYADLDPVTGRPGGAAPVEIRLRTQDENADAAAREYHNERILELSPDGKYLLVGTRISTRASVAELYRTSDGKLIRYWRPANLTGLVASLGNSDYFADVNPAGDSIGLIAWKSGAVVREIKTSGQIAAFCGAADGQQLLASVDRKKIARFDLKTGHVIGEMTSDFLPVACSPDGNLFIAFSPNPGQPEPGPMFEPGFGSIFELGSMLLVDGANGNIRAILSRGTRRGAPAQFAIDGRAFLLGSRDVADLVRSLSPQAADAVLAGITDPVDSAPQAPVATASPPLRLFPKQAEAIRPAAPSAPIDAGDMTRLCASIGIQAVVRGRSAWTGLTKGKDALIISFGKPGKSFTVYVPPEVLPALNARFGGSAVDALRQKLLQVTGKIITYRDLPEIKLTDASQLRTLESTSQEVQ